VKTRGITTTGADFWAHLFPESARLYWYPVSAMQAWIKDKKPQLRPGYSKDGTETGGGYTIPKDAPFVVCTKVPDRMLADFDWARANTDRQRGLWGEDILWWMLLVGSIRPPVWAVRRMDRRQEQFEIGDFELSFMPRPVFELKTEGPQYANSQNLFVQVKEGRHKPTLVRVSGGVVERHTPLPPLRD
jgi:hypothetical protein